MFITDAESLRLYAAERRVWQGIPGIERTAGGRLFSTFYSGGVREEWGNYVLLLKSDDDGYTWSEPIAACEDGPDGRCYDPCLWIDPQQRLWLFWAEAPNHMVWAVTCDEPDAAELIWTEPRPVGPEVMMNKPTVLSTGEWLLPIAIWGTTGSLCSATKDRRPYAFRSTDNGRSFVRLGGPQVEHRVFDEHMIVEQMDGTLQMLIRTRYGIARSNSVDGGRTWTPAVDSGIPGPSSRFFFRRLRSGALLLINHHHFQKRDHLTAMLSDDDGRSWNAFLLIDERENVSYPDATETADGFIYITYDRERGSYLHSLDEVLSKPREILMAKITEEDIRAGRLVNSRSRLRQVISRLETYEGDDPYAADEIVRSAEQVDALLQCGTHPAIVQAFLTRYGYHCMNISRETAAQIDCILERFLANEGLDDPVQDRYLLKQLIQLVEQGRKTQPEQTESIVERIFEQINARLSEEINITELADMMHMSKYYMCHLFREKTGTTIGLYRQSRRLQAAKQRLIGSSDTITDIAVSLGFSDASHFIRTFRRQENMTPGQYRKQGSNE